MSISGDFNVGIDQTHMKSFCETYNLTNQPTFYQNPDEILRNIRNRNKSILHLVFCFTLKMYSFWLLLFKIKLYKKINIFKALFESISSTVECCNIFQITNIVKMIFLWNKIKQTLW